MGFFQRLTKEVFRSQTDMLYRKFDINPEMGSGIYYDYFFDDVYLGVGHIQLKEDIRFQAKQRYDALEMSFLMEGELSVQMDHPTNSEIVYGSGQCYAVYLSEIAGTFYYGSGKPYKEIKIRLGEGFLAKHRLKEGYQLDRLLSLEKAQQPLIRYMEPHCRRLLGELMEIEQKGKGKRLFLEAKILELLSGFLEKKEVDYQGQEALIHKVHQVRDLLDGSPQKQWHIPDLARQVNLNEFVLKKEFKRIFQSTLFEYAAHGRMELAKRLLRTTQKPVYEIAEEVGYKNATHFTAAFKKREGVTPKLYRNVK
ncbi:helix-turn-helix transcriptional regulator [Sediminicola luteus]|uniref:HTH araC/xylS-type domain-containing protein n=1 Tax=Sediminicola luteus TaxID=319238 RepID=A0A2A4G7M4_9FLAO|nr:AraC family transcriptional regulator [Sediminicola luteus]PCE64431.1 hypothetical protein B7P33_09080 [Sediminicola luteus]